MRHDANPKIRVGIGGWTYAPWRGAFYPDGLPHRSELDYASRRLGTIEINGTYYGSQKPQSFAKWYDETPDDFIFSLKGPRFATNRRVLAEAGSSVERFFSSGVTELKEKLGPVNWQFMPTKTFDAEDFRAFLDLLPGEVDGRKIRHAVELRHASFANPECVKLARERDVAIILAGDSAFPQIADITSSFVYIRIMGTSESEESGYSEKAIDLWVERMRQLSAGTIPDGFAAPCGPPARAAGRDVFLYVISGFKLRNPAAAMALTRRLAEA
jgi:uncharacterized protein YecE (DUF72 family)